MIIVQRGDHVGNFVLSNFGLVMPVRIVFREGNALALGGMADHCAGFSCCNWQGSQYATQGADIVTSGGRVLCVTALGDTVRQAQAHAYELVDAIHFDGAQVRRDIGHRGVKR